MIKDLSTELQDALMKIAAAAYETGEVTAIDARIPLSMFMDIQEEFPDHYNSDDEAWIIDFESDVFMDAYIAFKNLEISRMNEIGTGIPPQITASNIGTFEEEALIGYFRGNTGTLH